LSDQSLVIKSERDSATASERDLGTASATASEIVLAIALETLLEQSTGLRRNKLQ